MQEKKTDITDNVTYNPTQEKMLQYSLYYPDKRAIYAHGGVRSGKSFGVCKAALLLAFTYPGSKVLIARDTRVNLKNTTLSTFFGVDAKGNRVIPEGTYNPKDYNKTEGNLKWVNGSTTFFWGLDKPEDIERVKSTEWSAIIIEEAPGIDIEVITFLLETRLSHAVGPHKLLLTSNTDSGHSDIYRLFYDTHVRDTEDMCEQCAGPCEFVTIPSNTLENEENLPERYVKRIKRLEFTNPRYYRVYVMGEFMEFTKKIFPEFDQNLHVVDIPPGWKEPPGTQTVYGYDHGYSGAPTALLTCKILPCGTYLFWDEYYETGEHVKTMADYMKDNDIFYVHAADPSIRAKTQYKEHKEGQGELQSVQDLYTHYGVTLELANNDVSGGIEKMKSLFLDDPEHQHPFLPDIDHAPFIMIARRDGHNTCPNLTRQIQKYRNKVNAKGQVNPGKWDPVKEDDHSLDAGRYIVNSPIGSDVPAAALLPKQGTVKWVKHWMKDKVKRQERKEVELSEAI